MKRLLIKNAHVADGHHSFDGYVLVEGERIKSVGEGDFKGPEPAEVIDAAGNLLMPGVIDDQVHFRQPGLTYKGDIHSESTAAAAGGVTSYMEMPNTVPQTTTTELLEEKLEMAARDSVANYSFYMGATNDNIDQIRKIDPRRVAGVKVFMGSSTGNMLVDNEKSLAAIFAESPVLVATHCEEESIIAANLAYYKNLYGEDIEPRLHPLIRSAQACYASSSRAVELAEKYGTDLHVLHVSTAREMCLFDTKPLTDKHITCEVCVHHLWFDDRDYRRKGNLIKWNPAIKSEDDRRALTEGLHTGKVDVVATDHAPHTLEEKRRPYLQAPSGGPLVQHSLAMMLEMYKRGEVSIGLVVEKMCHAPAIRFGVRERGFIREGYYADLVIVDLNSRHVVEGDNILYKCGWSPLEGEHFTTQITHTLINGSVVFQNGETNREFRGKMLEFER